MLEEFLRQHTGIHHAAANYVNDTVVVGYDKSLITIEEIRCLIEDCGLHCKDEPIPQHLCPPEINATDDPASQPRG